MSPFFVKPLIKYFEGLKFPYMFGIVALMFGLDLIIPDLIPFADEILLGAVTILLGAWKTKRAERVKKTKSGDVIDVEAKETAST